MSTNKDTDKKKDTCDKKIEKLEKQIKKFKNEKQQLLKELEEKNDKFLRTRADIDNFQKRMNRELSLKIEELRIKYLTEIIDLYEILKKAQEDTNPKEGIKLILNNIDNLFEKEEIKYIDCMGKSFNHELHHAVTICEKDDCESDTIVEEVKKGYMIGDKLLRPSQVIVAKRKEE